MRDGVAHNQALIALVRELQGDESQLRFAERLGINQGDLSRFLRTGRRCGRGLIVGLFRAFPERRDEIVKALLVHETGSSASRSAGTPNLGSDEGAGTALGAPPYRTEEEVPISQIA